MSLTCACAECPGCHALWRSNPAPASGLRRHRCRCGQVWGHASQRSLAATVQWAVEHAVEYFAGVMIYGINRTAWRSRGLPSNALFWPFGERVSTIVSKLQDDIAADGDYSVADTSARINQQARYFGTCLAFVNDWLEARPTRAPRHAIRRLQQAQAPEQLLAEPNVRVVTLRRKKASSGGQPTAVTWSCQWQVRGHWREQWYPSEGRRKPKWVAPYWKGPELAPIKPPGTTLFRVVR
jgi:hypothetical protein